MDQIKQIFAVMGTPTDETWPGWDQLPYFKTFKVCGACKWRCRISSRATGCAGARDSLRRRRSTPRLRCESVCGGWPHALLATERLSRAPPLLPPTPLLCFGPLDQVAPGKPSVLRQHFPRVNLGAGPMLSDAGFDLLSRLLALNPTARLSAKDALDHEWFKEGPLPAPQSIMPSFPSRAAGERE
jgi:serine/threonine protein kinase